MESAPLISPSPPRSPILGDQLQGPKVCQITRSLAFVHRRSGLESAAPDVRLPLLVVAAWPVAQTVGHYDDGRTPDPSQSDRTPREVSERGDCDPDGLRHDP